MQYSKYLVISSDCFFFFIVFEGAKSTGTQGFLLSILWLPEWDYSYLITGQVP